MPAGGDKALPKYAGEKNEDINAFFYKLRIFLSCPSINNCHQQKQTTDENIQESKNLRTLLGLCLSGEALHPFLANTRFDNKGIEMYYHLRQMKNPISQAYISTLFQSIFHTKIKKNESFDSFGKQRRIIFRSCKEAGFPEDKAYLICCYIRSLDSNYDNIRELLDTNALDWFNKTLDEVIQLTTDIKLNKTTTGS